MPIYKKLKEEDHQKIAKEVEFLLHASRDCMRNQGIDTKLVPWNVGDGYYAEAFGIIRALIVLRYGFRCDDEHDLMTFFENIKDSVLITENFKGTNECDFCVAHFGKDGMGRTR